MDKKQNKLMQIKATQTRPW